ncbi:MAG TPA: hypothetical protein ENF42_01440 [Candidatus Bathyarchaeota archaeon]|nr:hypothetical protein [Candidatus Bathyarchaeota archaeon]
MVRPIEKIVALKDIEITVHEVQKVRKVKALKLNQELKFKVGSNGIVVRLPVLQEYEALVIETT